MLKYYYLLSLYDMQECYNKYKAKLKRFLHPGWVFYPNHTSISTGPMTNNRTNNHKTKHPMSFLPPWTKHPTQICHCAEMAYMFSPGWQKWHGMISPGWQICVGCLFRVANLCGMFFLFFFSLVSFIFYIPVSFHLWNPGIFRRVSSHTYCTYIKWAPLINTLPDSLDPVVHICFFKEKHSKDAPFSQTTLKHILVYIYTVKLSTVVPTKSDSDVGVCLQLLIKTLTCTRHLS